MIRRENRVVSVTGLRDSRFGPNASTCVLARRTKAQELQIDPLWRRSRVFQRMRKTLLVTSRILSRSCDDIFQHYPSASRWNGTAEAGGDIPIRRPVPALGRATSRTQNLVRNWREPNVPTNRQSAAGRIGRDEFCTQSARTLCS